MSTPPLLPCPFCGRPGAMIQPVEGLGHAWNAYCTGADDVLNPDCGVVQYGLSGQTQEHVAGLWNRRAVSVDASELLPWLRDQLAKAEKALRCREEGERVWRSGTDKTWAKVARMHPSTAKEPPLKKAARLKNAEAEKRIAEWCRRDVVMFKAVLAAFEPEGSK